MSVRRLFITLFLVTIAASLGRSDLVAQSTTPSPASSASSAPSASSSSGTGLLVPVTGVADLGGLFGGALLIQRFAVQNNGVVAVGMVTGALTQNGTVRNLVMNVTLPLDINASRARLNTDAALAQSACDVLHVELATAAVNVLGSTLALNPVSFDIASPVQTSGTPATTSSGSTATTSQMAVGTAQPGTVPSSSSANTTQPTAASPAPGAVTPTPTAPAAPQTPLGSMLCSLDRFRNVGNTTQLVQQLNGILTALSTTSGS